MLTYPNNRRWLRPIVGALVAVLFLYLTLRKLEWTAIRHAWHTAIPGALVLAIVALTAGYSVRIARWWVMLRVLNPSLSYTHCVRPFLASIAINNTMPLRAGDVVRAFGFRGVLDVSPAKVVGTLVVERLLDLVLLLAVFFAGLLGVARGAVPSAFITAGTLLFTITLVGLLMLMFTPGLIEWCVANLMLRPLGRFGKNSSGRVVNRIHGVTTQLFGTLTQLLTPARALLLIVLSIVSWGFEGCVYACVAWALHSSAAAFGPFFALATGTLATLLPSSPGYVGTFDYFAALGLASYGATRTSAAAFALLTHFVLWLPPTVAGALCLLSSRAHTASVDTASTGVPAVDSAPDLNAMVP